MEYETILTDEYLEWFEGEKGKSRLQIEHRIEKIEVYGHFGTCKDLKDEVWELKWGNGRRVYYAYLPEEKILLLLGGNKNGQQKDIRRAKKIYKNYTKKKGKGDD